MTAGNVEVRWMPGLGCCPGAVNLTTVGPLGRIDRAVAVPEALALAAVIDMLCPAPCHVHETVSCLVPGPMTAQRGR